MKRNTTILVIILFFFTLALQAQSRQASSFTGVAEIRLETVSGNCLIERSESSEVTVEVDSSFDRNSYEADMEQRGGVLILKERFHGRSNSGTSNWSLFVPDNIRIDFSTASGDFEMTGLRTEIEVQTASGDITLNGLAGELEASTASGDVIGRDLRGLFRFSSASGNVEVENSAGEFELSSASGNVRAANLAFDSESSFSSASGDAFLSLAATPGVDLRISSASGDAILEINGVTLNAYVEATARRARSIEAPFAFDREERVDRWNREYVRKGVSLGQGGPLIEVSTASGRVEIRR